MTQRIEHLICIGCPSGCPLDVTVDDASGTPQVVDITGYSCKIGHDYGIQEATAPKRMVTACVAVEGSFLPVSVKTSSSVPKDRIAAVLDAIHALSPSAPIVAGSVLIEDVADTGVNIIATKSV